MFLSKMNPAFKIATRSGLLVSKQNVQNGTVIRSVLCNNIRQFSVLQDAPVSLVVSPKIKVPSEFKAPKKEKREAPKLLLDEDVQLKSADEHLEILEKCETYAVIDCIERVGLKKYNVSTLREQGYIVGSITGFDRRKEKSVIPIAMKFGDIVRQLHERQGSFENTMYELKFRDGRRFAVVVSENMMHPLYDYPYTLNFKLYKPEGTKIDMPMLFMDQDRCPAVKRGGYVNDFSFTLNCNVKGYSIPNSLHFSVADKEVGDRIMFSERLNAENVAIGKYNRKREEDPIVATIKGKAVDDEEEDDFEALFSGEGFDVNF